MRSEAAKDRIICTPAWVAPPPRVALPCDAVHVWRVGLIDPPDHVNHLAASLSPDERDRADRFHFERDRHRYVIGRGTLRTILGAYLGVPPGSLRFGYGPSGKPFVAEPADAARLQFNLSHAGALALVAVAHGRAVGVDLEQVRALPDRDLISTRFFSALERAALQALAPGRGTRRSSPAGPARRPCSRPGATGFRSRSTVSRSRSRLVNRRG